MSHRKASPLPATARTAYTIWLASPPLPPHVPVGYIVAPTNSPDQPIALVTTPGGFGEEKALGVAHRIVQSPQGSWRGLLAPPSDPENPHLIDLRSYGNAESTKPTPLALFGLMVTQVDSHGEPLPNANPMEYWPRCGHRTVQMTQLVRSALKRA